MRESHGIQRQTAAVPWWAVLSVGLGVVGLVILTLATGENPWVVLGALVGAFVLGTGIPGIVHAYEDRRLPLTSAPATSVEDEQPRRPVMHRPFKTGARRRITHPEQRPRHVHGTKGQRPRV